MIIVAYYVRSVVLPTTHTISQSPSTSVLYSAEPHSRSKLTLFIRYSHTIGMRMEQLPTYLNSDRLTVFLNLTRLRIMNWSESSVSRV